MYTCNLWNYFFTLYFSCIILTMLGNLCYVLLDFILQNAKQIKTTNDVWFSRKTGKTMNKVYKTSSQSLQNTRPYNIVIKY